MTLLEGETQVECTLLLGTCDIEPQPLSGVYSKKSDVFCFGMLLLNLVTEKKYYGLSEIMSSIDTIMSRIRNLPINMIVDPTILEAEAEAVLHIILSVLEITQRRGQLCWMFQNNSHELKSIFLHSIPSYI